MSLSPLFVTFARPRHAVWLALLLAAPGVAVAGATPSAPVSAQQLQDASVLAGTCANCHGPDGRAPQGSPLPGLRVHSADYLQQRLLAFKSGQVQDATVMTRLMKGYDTTQIQALAEWFAAKEAK